MLSLSTLPPIIYASNHFNKLLDILNMRRRNLSRKNYTSKFYTRNMSPVQNIFITCGHEVFERIYNHISGIQCDGVTRTIRNYCSGYGACLPSARLSFLKCRFELSLNCFLGEGKNGKNVLKV